MKKPKKEKNYVALHNQAVLRYQKTALFLLWAGLVSLIAIVISVLRNNRALGMALTLNVFLNNLLLESSLSDILKQLLIIVLAIVTASLFTVLGYFARLGKIVFLLIGGSLYFFDFIGTFFFYPLVFEMNFMFSIATHLVILGAIIIAIVMYYRVLRINKEEGKLVS